jgi:osmotically-inducible protein OsmY
MVRKNLLILSFVVALSTNLYGCFPIIAGTGIYSAMVLADRRPVSTTTIDRGLQLELEALIKKKSW